jgi:hypothetical protein
MSLAGYTILAMTIVATTVQADSTPSPENKQQEAAPKLPARKKPADFGEYEIKAGFIYRFLSFVNWPNEQEKQATISIGVLGESPFGNAFDAITQKADTSQRIRVIGVDWNTDVETLKELQILFITRSETKDLKRILTRLDNYPVLTIGDARQFIDKGGMIGFVNKPDSKIGIELNVAAAQRCGITVRAMLKRIASRIIDTQLIESGILK